jgi:hypothetical protein
MAPFSENIIEHEMCVVIFFTNLTETFLVLTRTERDINVHRSSPKVPCYSWHVLMNVQYCGHILEKYWNIKVYEKVPLGTELFYAGWQTDRNTGVTKLIIAFRDFSNASKNCKTCILTPLTEVHFKIIFKETNTLTKVFQTNHSQRSIL